MVGFWAIVGGNADWGAVVAFETPDDKNVFLAVTTATSLAFFAMVGFEDAVNMAEECHEPNRIFPKIMLTGLGVTGLIYILVSICAVAIVPVGELAGNDTPLVTVVEQGAPDIPIDQILPFISMFAVANSALINMLMASRLLYGMAKQGVIPTSLAKISGRQTPSVAIGFTTALALGLIAYVSNASDDAVAVLGGTTSLLLLAVFAIVNLAVLVLRKDTVDHSHFRTAAPIALLGVVTCVYLVTPLSGRPSSQYEVAGILLVIGLVLSVPMYLLSRRRGEPLEVKDPDDLPPHGIP